MTRRLLVFLAGLSLLVAGLALPGLAVSASAAGDPPLTRWSGADRYATAVEISKATFSAGSDVVFVANGLAFPDGLAAGPAASKLGGPLLLVPGPGVPSRVTAEISRLNPKTIYILGGTTAVSDAVSDQLDALATDGVTRLWGPSRYGSAASVSSLWATADTVYLASGQMFPDALSGGAAAARDGAPLLLTAQKSLPIEANAALSDLDPSRVVIIGGLAAVSDNVKAQVASLLPNATIDRVGGSDRYETSAMLVSRSSGAPTKAMIASGMDFPDAMAGVPASAAMSTTFALSGQNCLPKAVRTALDQIHTDSYVLLGGTSVLNDSLVSTTCAPPGPKTPTGPVAKAVPEALGLVNAERAKVNLPALTASRCAQTFANRQAVAQAKANRMHHTPDISTVLNGCGSRTAGENVAYGYPDAASVMRGWMNSRDHRDNILRKTFTSVAVAVAYSSNGTPYYAQIFLG